MVLSELYSDQEESLSKKILLSELENGVLLSTKAKALEKDKFTIRIWIKDDPLLPNGSKYHYHGLIQVIENDTTLAVK